MTKFNLLKYIKLFSLIGIGLAIYLLYEQFTKLPSPCNINSTINCNSIISGEVANTFGIPTPLIGLMGYVCIFLAAWFSKKKTILGFAAFGVIFCLWIAYIELFLLHVICPLCLLCQAVMITILVLAYLLYKKK
jgi:uncharacterized membrane protein